MFHIGDTYNRNTDVVEKKRMGYTSVSVLGLEDYLIRLYFQSNFFPVSFCSFFY